MSLFFVGLLFVFQLLILVGLVGLFVLCYGLGL